jgi:hypothetical protein
MRSFTKTLKDWLSDPLAVQAPIGLKVDADFNPPQPGFWGTLLGVGSDGKVYTMDAAAHKRLRPIILRDPRAVRNEEIAAAARQRRADRGGDHLPITIIPYGMEEYEPLPEASILPPAPRPALDWVEWDDIIMPPQGAGDGNPGR